MKKTYRKNMWRELAANKSRFASLFGIVLLGVMMLSGLLSVAPRYAPGRPDLVCPAERL